MNHHIVRPLLFTFCFIGSSIISAAEFIGLGDLPGRRINSAAYGISGDGKVVFGKSDSRIGSQAFKWTAETGIVGLGIPSGTNSSQALNSSYDGSVIVGNGAGGAALIWTADGMQKIAGLRSLNAVSGDGSTMVANSCCPESAIWTEQKGVNEIGSLPSYSGKGIARDISGDGTTVVGIAGKLTGPGQAYLWTESNGMEGLGFLDRHNFSIAEAISADGSTVVGSSESNSAAQAFRWTRESGMVALGDLLGGQSKSFAYDVSGDGSVIVGSSRCSADFNCAFIWDEAHGMRDLQDVLINDYGLRDKLDGWELTTAWGVSDDGQVLVGIGTRHPSGNREAWIATLKAALQAGDADMDLDFDQLDLVKVQIAAKYLTGQNATWGEGDWDGAPGGTLGNPPQGNRLFDQLDVVAALGANTYLSGPYAAVLPNGQRGDGQTSLVYNADLGELAVDPPAGLDLTSINIISDGNRFNGDKPAALDGAFDNFDAGNVFKATFGGSFGNITFGNILPEGLSETEVTLDLSVVGSLAGGGGLGDVDLIYVPEPSVAALILCGVLVLSIGRQRLCWR